MSGFVLLDVIASVVGSGSAFVTDDVLSGADSVPLMESSGKKASGVVTGSAAAVAVFPFAVGSDDKVD